MKKNSIKLVVESVDQNGNLFRPSNWIERIAALTAEYESDNRLRYSKTVQPRFIDGEKCLVVDPRLRDHAPSIFEYILGFVSSNNLNSYEDCLPDL
jgi:hypothetical protein